MYCSLGVGVAYLDQRRTTYFPDVLDSDAIKSAPRQACGCHVQDPEVVPERCCLLRASPGLVNQPSTELHEQISVSLAKCIFAI